MEAAEDAGSWEGKVSLTEWVAVWEEAGAPGRLVLTQELTEKPLQVAVGAASAPECRMA